MKSEIIFNHTSTWRGRYGDDEGFEITVSADFSNPAAWPFNVKRADIAYDDDTYEETKTEAFSARLSKAAFDKIKSVIRDNRSLRYDSDEIDTNVMDGSNDEFFFGCDEYSRTVGGLSVLSIGKHEEELAPNKRSIAYTVYTVYEEIMNILSDVGIDPWA